MKTPTASRIVDFGIESLGSAFGDDQDVATAAGDYVTDPERIRQWGYRTFHRAPADVQATDLAAAAARQALDRLGLDPGDLDLIVLASSELPEYPYWDTAAALARELKVDRAQTLQLNEGCGSGVTGLFYVAGTMALQPEIDTALFVAVNRVSEFHRNRMNVNNAVHSDGAAAAVLRRGHRSCRWLATDQFTIPEYCDLLRTDFGGAVSPLPPPGWASTPAPAGNQTLTAQFGKDVGKLKRFRAERSDSVAQVVDRACARAGLSRDDVSHLIYIHDGPDSIIGIAGRLGLPPERTNAGLAPDHGHMGAADQLVSLALHLDRGDLHPGDVVALCGISTGMHWCCTLLQI
jgi:3-oxoacyl-[acyl-carrier-protein] synthase-3